MSWWGTIDAKFTPMEHDKGRLSKKLKQGIEEREILAPTGSEGGPSVHVDKGGVVWVEGRMRDVSDESDAAKILAWFVHHCYLSAETAEIEFDFDSGPRYRYKWEGGNLIKLKGCLD